MSKDKITNKSSYVSQLCGSIRFKTLIQQCVVQRGRVGVAHTYSSNPFSNMALNKRIKAVNAEKRQLVFLSLHYYIVFVGLGTAT